MAGSRTGTAQWFRVRDQARAQALEAGLTRCPVCGVHMDWEYSGRPNSAEVDHIVPHAKGGADVIENCRVICRQCNQRLGGQQNRRKPRARVKTTVLETAMDW